MEDDHELYKVDMPVVICVIDTENVLLHLGNKKHVLQTYVYYSEANSGGWAIGSGATSTFIRPGGGAYSVEFFSKRKHCFQNLKQKNSIY